MFDSTNKNSQFFFIFAKYATFISPSKDNLRFLLSNPCFPLLPTIWMQREMNYNIGRELCRLCD